jgi:DNA-binding XRE family transcriptional regulator
MKKDNIITFEEHLEANYGKRGDPKRESHEEGYETFKIGVLIGEARKRLNMTQQELADRAGTSKAYISRIEHDASDIRLSTLMKIVNKGLGGKLVVQVDMSFARNDL